MKRALTFAVIAFSAVAFGKDFTLTILHTNDMHSHVEASKIKGEMVGGYARQQTLIKQFRKSDENTVLLNAGDTFQGTLFFNQYLGLADLAFMNSAGYDAMALGNHEFDKGPEVLAEFIKRANFPVLCCNLDFTNEPSLKDRVKPSTVLTVGGEKIGVVGAITTDLPSISSPGPNIGMKHLAKSVQAEIDKLTGEGVNKIILLTHIGYGEDLDLAKQVKGADVIVGGHSHTFLCDTDLGPLVNPAGKYPTEAKGADGKRVLVVQAADWSKVLGRMKVTFNAAGDVIGVSDAKPILIDKNVPEDPIIKSIVDALNVPIDGLKKKVISKSDAGITRTPARSGESPMGNVIADSMLAATEKAGAKIALMNAGGIRAAIEPGEITYEHAINVQPFGNTLVLIDLSGAELRAAFELAIGTKDEGGAGFLHVSRGTTVIFDRSKPFGKRVVSVSLDGKPLADDQVIRIVTNNFLAGGGDAHVGLKNAKGYRLDTGFVDIDAFVAYLTAKAPVKAEVEGRIVVK